MHVVFAYGSHILISLKDTSPFNGEYIPQSCETVWYQDRNAPPHCVDGGSVLRAQSSDPKVFPIGIYYCFLLGYIIQTLYATEMQERDGFIIVTDVMAEARLSVIITDSSRSLYEARV